MSDVRLGWRRCASLKALQTLKDVDLDIAREIRKVWKTKSGNRSARELVGALFGTDVEYLGHSKTGYDIYYCNAGDPYAPTIIFKGYNLSVGCWADYHDKLKVPEYG